jgi:putative methyltransferase (TIGR04325 family)
MARLGEIEFEEGFKSWEAASAASTGYDHASILEKARNALLKVKRGEAAFERDTVLLDRPQRAHPVIVALLKAAMANAYQLTVLDFGGSLGSSYFQSRAYLNRLSRLTWCIVEQPHFVECGKREFETDTLRFYENVDKCARDHRVDVVLLSGVLEYLRSPFDLLTDLVRHGFAHIVIDRTPLIRAGESHITVQHVPASIYKASYPCWFLSRSQLVDALAPAYRITDEFPSATEGSITLTIGEAHFKGFHFIRS